jgi:alpha-galactosidase
VTRTVNSYLLDLGNDEAQRWLTDFLCDFIQMHGVKIYRQDFNFPPLTCWNANEAEDRQGFLENRHVQGCLAFWDALLERNHGLSIDSCAAGGRRNDLETMRRSVSFLKSDYGYDIPGEKRAFHQTLYQWIPYFASHTIAKRLEEETTDYKWKRPKNQFDSYAFHHTLKKGCDYYGYLYTSGPACV